MINRDLYKGWLNQDNMSKWQCPTCHTGSLQVKQDKFIKDQNSVTKINYHEEWFQVPDMIEYTFTALLFCTNTTCKDVVTCSGAGCVETEYYYDYNGEAHRDYVDYYKPLFFYPPLQLFCIPEKTPEDVQKSIQSSFSLLFNNQSAAANQIRIAIECLLNHLKVKKTHIINSKRKRITLHRRIELLPTKYKKIKDILLAIKWLGNAGSHCDDEMTVDDVFDGYDMLSFILEELYDNKHKHVTKLAKKFNTKRGV